MPTRTSSERRSLVCALFCIGLAANAAWGVGTITGHARFEKIKGKPHMGYVELYEYNAILSPASSPPTGPCRRTGAPPNQVPTGDGFYSMDMPAGTYSMILTEPVFFTRTKVVPNLKIFDGQTTTAHLELSIDYSTYYRLPNQWTEGGTPWYQTFKATGTSITGVAFVFAGISADAALAAVLEDNGDPDVRNWKLLGERTDFGIAAAADNWVRWRSGEIPTVPGKRYAVRVRGRSGLSVQPWYRNKDANSYPDGQAYGPDGVPRNYDFNFTVFSDNDGTIVTMNKRTDETGHLRDGYYGGRWGQTFISKGGSLAGVDLFAAGANTWDLDFTWKLRAGGPDGPQIGPTKTTKAGFYGATVGVHGVSYNPGEVPLVSGQTYCIEVTNSPGFNPFVMNADSYADGMAYQDGAARANDDLSMTIMEYAMPTPIIVLNKAQVSRSIYMGTSLANDTFTVKNGTSGTMKYTITDDAAWISTSPSSGSSTGEEDAISIIYNVAGLAKGQYTATVSVFSNDTLNSPQTITVNLDVYTVRPDFDGDRDVDQADFGHFQACLSGSGFPQSNPACFDARLDSDEDVDLDDFGIFQKCVSGAGISASPTCAD